VQQGYPLFDPGSPHFATSGACALAIVTKAPRLGAVKTRLVPPLKAEEATSLHISFLRDPSANIAELASGDNIHGFASYTPLGEDSACGRTLSPGFHFLPQRGKILGERLFHTFEDLFLAGYETACLINSDSPTLPSDVLREAVETLRKPGDRLVLGEALDGGYYLIGLKQAHRRLFEAISWSTEKVFLQTLDRASEVRLETKVLTVWYDVDDVGSLRRLCAELFPRDRRSTGSSVRRYDAPNTAPYLRQLLDAGAGPRLGLEHATPE
jgi:rSAM/selenodomain-associated transferase 1